MKVNEEKQDKLTHELVRKMFDYNEETGELIWKWHPYPKRMAALVGNPIKGLSRNGYKRVHISGDTHYLHRMIWFWNHGEWPSKSLDHINNDKTDNRLCNLREATSTQNARNKKMNRPKGVHKHRDKYRSRIQVNGRKVHLGCFDTPEEAHNAYCEAAEKHFAEFANTG